MNKIYKNIVALTMASLIIIPAFTMALNAQAQGVDAWGGHQSNIQTTTGLGNRDPRDIAASVIKVILGFLGIIAVVIILLGGFKWMTAAGNEDSIDEAKKLISAGIIGLVIILAAFGVATFVIDNLISATTTG